MARPGLVVASALALATALSAAVATESQVAVTLVVILAGEEGTEVDPRLGPIADEIKKQNPTLKSFRIKSMTKRTLAENEKSEFDLVEGHKAVIAVKHPDADGKIAVSVTPPEQGEIAYRTVPGKFLPIVTRNQTKDRLRLIFAVRVDVVK